MNDQNDSIASDEMYRVGFTGGHFLHFLKGMKARVPQDGRTVFSGTNLECASYLTARGHVAPAPKLADTAIARRMVRGTPHH